MSVCAECGDPMPAPAETGRPRLYCSASCRRVVERRITRAARLAERIEGAG